MSNSPYRIGESYGTDLQTYGTEVQQPTSAPSGFSSFDKNLRRGGVTSTLDDKTNYQFFDQVVDTNTYTAHPEEKKNNTIMMMGAAAAILLIILMNR